MKQDDGENNSSDSLRDRIVRGTLEGRPRSMVNLTDAEHQAVNRQQMHAQNYYDLHVTSELKLVWSALEVTNPSADKHLIPVYLNIKGMDYVAEKMTDAICDIISEIGGVVYGKSHGEGIYSEQIRALISADMLVLLSNQVRLDSIVATIGLDLGFESSYRARLVPELSNDLKRRVRIPAPSVVTGLVI